MTIRNSDRIGWNYFAIPMITIILLVITSQLTDNFVILFLVACIIYMSSFFLALAINRQAGKSTFKSKKHGAVKFVLIFLKALVFAGALVGLTAWFISGGEPLFTIDGMFLVTDLNVAGAYCLVYSFIYALLLIFTIVLT